MSIILKMENENEIYKRIINFYNNSYINNENEEHDLSYNKWVTKDNNIKLLCTHINIPKDKELIDKIIERRDYECELKLIKWITEDKEHKNQFIKNTKNHLNKSSEILPYEFNCVSMNKDDNHNNYINASYISGLFNEDKIIFIATQEPCKENVFSFWSMIISHKINIIINFTDKTNECYFPIKKGDNLIIEKIIDKEEENNINTDLNENIIISLLDEEFLIENHLILRILKVNEDIEIKQYQILNWEQHYIPNDEIIANKIINHLIKVVNINRKQKPDIPILIHCLAGIGNTGMFIAIYQIIKCLETIKGIKKDYILNVFNIVRKLREQRYSMVTDTSQYKFIYTYCLNWIKENIDK